MPDSSKARVEAIQQAARALLDARNIDITQQVYIKPLAEQLAQQVGCHVSTATRHIAKAVRVKRGEFTAQRGGARPGAGRKPKQGDD